MKMQELQSSPEANGWLAAVLYKFLPGALGAFIMVMVDVPQTKRDLFTRLFVAFVASVILGEVVFDYLRTWSSLAFLNPAKGSHVAAVNFITGGVGWFVIGGGVMYLKSRAKNPDAAIEDAKALKP